jgi:hypothetical protein
MNSSGRIAAVVLGLGLISLPMNPQQAPPTFKTDVTEVEAPFKAGVTVVNVPVTVRGRGILVTDLVFEIIGDEKLTAGQFLEKVLRPHDSGIIVSFADSVVLWQDFTSSINLLKAGLTNLKDVGAPAPLLRRDP